MAYYLCNLIHETLAWYDKENLQFISENFKIVIIVGLCYVYMRLETKSDKVQEKYEQLQQQRYVEQRDAAKAWQDAYFKTNSYIVHDTVYVSAAPNK